MPINPDDHPSLLFQRGEIKDFRTAMQTYIAQQEFENLQARQHGATRLEMEQGRESLRKIIEATKQAEQIYEAIVVPALHEAAEAMRDTGNLHLIDFAKALETGDYTDLAI